MSNFHQTYPPKETLHKDDLDQFVMDKTSLLNDDESFKEFYRWYVDEPFRAYIESTPQSFEYEFLKSTHPDPSRDENVYINSYYSRNGMTLREIFDWFKASWDRKIIGTIRESGTRIKFYLGSTLYAGVFHPSIISSFPRLVLVMEVWILEDGEWVNMQASYRKLTGTQAEINPSTGHA